MRTVRPGRLGAREAGGLLLAVVGLVALSACGDADDPSTTPTTIATSTPSDSPASESPSAEPTASATPSETESEDAADVEIEVTVSGDTVTTASDRVAVEVGQTVRLTVLSDVADEVHVHGYDLTLDLEPGVPGVLEFEVTADPGPGLYEVELEERALLLFQLEVR